MLSRLLKKPTQTGPAYAKKSLFGDEQRAFYQRLRRAFPNCLFFPDIALSALLEPLATEPRRVRQQQEQLNGRKATYAVYNGVLELLCVIELTDADTDQDQRALTLEYLQDAGIKHFSWKLGQLPSDEQMLRAMAAISGIEPPKFESTVNTVVRLKPDAPAARVAVPRHHVSCSSLTLQEVQALTPDGHVKTAYPHIWERICLFHNDPRHLEQYLSSLSLQDRGGKRAGFPAGVIAELAELQGANARFIPTQTEIRAGWNDFFVNR